MPQLKSRKTKKIVQRLVQTQHQAQARKRKVVLTKFIPPINLRSLLGLLSIINSKCLAISFNTHIKAWKNLLRLKVNNQTTNSLNSKQIPQQLPDTLTILHSLSLNLSSLTIKNTNQWLAKVIIYLLLNNIKTTTVNIHNKQRVMNIKIKNNIQAIKIMVNKILKTH